MPAEFQSPRVLHIVPAVFHAELGVIGGAERFAHELARHMAEIVPTTLVGFGPRAASWRDGPLAIRVIPTMHYVRGQRQNPLSWELLPELLHHDIVHCHQKHILTHSLTALFGRLVGKKVFTSDHGGGGWDISAYISTDRWFAAELHDSQYSRRLAGQVDKSWSHVIYGGVDTKRFSPANDGRQFSRDDPAVFVGRLMSHKGVDTLVAAAEDDIRVDIMGRASNETYLRDLHGLASGPNVRFIHDATDADLVRALRSALCVVLPSVYRDRYGNETLVPELLGQTLLEGMSCGVPGVATDVASLPEVVEDGVSGFIVPPNDPAALRGRLLWLRDHPGEAAKMGNAARRRILDRFTWPAVARHCLEIYGK